MPSALGTRGSLHHPKDDVMPASFRFTSSGACARCGAYGGTQHSLPNCQDQAATKFKRGHMPHAARDARISEVIRAWQEAERELVEHLS